MQTVTNPFQACNDIFFKPNGVFKAVGEKSNWSWLPFILVMLIAVSSQYLYINFVDIEWFANANIAAKGDMSPAEADQMRAFFTRDTMMMSNIIGIFFGLIIVNAISAAYLNIMTRSDDSHVFGFTDWYGFTWWVSMPYVLTGLVSVVLLLMASDHQVSPSVLAPLSVAYIFNIDVGSTWFALAQSMRIELFLGIYLTTVGITQWTSFTTKKALVIAAAPYAIIYGIWFVVALF